MFIKRVWEERHPVLPIKASSSALSKVYELVRCNVLAKSQRPLPLLLLRLPLLGLASRVGLCLRRSI